MNDFLKNVVRFTGAGELRSHDLQTIQVNVGLRCNLSCHHCHVGAAPNRTEEMRWETMERILDLADRTGVRFVDLTGGAPELNPHIKPFIEALTERRITVQVRTNLTVHLEPEMAGMGAFFRDHRVQLVGSMPCYLEQNVAAQRGAGVYQKSVAAIQRLNALGYGVQPELPLNLVYNPGGPSLPPAQGSLEADYRRELDNRFGLAFTNLLTIANMPIGRFRADLRRQGREAEYWTLLNNAFNPGTLDGLMCRNQVSVAWDGTLYDCDFNLALRIPLAAPGADHIEACDPERLAGRVIATGDHCLGCSAGAGSSCQGTLVA